MAWVEKSGKNSWRVRYFRDDGSIASIPGFPNKTAAQSKADDLESDRREGRWHDPAAGKILFAEWAEEWLDTIDVGKRTEENYRSRLTNHILPRWTETALIDISTTKVAAWAKQLRRCGLAEVTVSDILKQFTLMLADAVEDRRIPTNPVRTRRRGKRQRRTRTPEKVWAEPVQVVQVADQAVACYGIDAGMLIVTGAFTGARWGELTGLQRCNLHLAEHDDTGYFDIDPEIGALHESSKTGRLWLGPPKTEESARRVTLPPFLVRLLRSYLTTHDHLHVFPTPDRQLHRRSNFSRRTMRPAADGNLDTKKPKIRTHPVCTGLTFHGLRHGHKTWMIADGIPDVGQARRLGHKLPDKIEEIYSHVAAEVEKRILDTIETRWADAITNIPATGAEAAWRNP